MRKSILKEFGQHRPRAIVLDDDKRLRRMTARRLKSRGFDVIECSNADEFLKLWVPGTVDVIVADWQLSHDKTKFGDRVLTAVRKRDWDVPFVLISGKLDEDDERAKVLQTLLEGGSARFVRRGSAGIKQACADAEDLIERRDLGLLKLILSMRDAALAGAAVRTSKGDERVAKLLQAVVSSPPKSHDAERPIAARLAMPRAAS